MPGQEPFSVWAARPEDVILSKLVAWDEGKSDPHPADIFEMMVFHYLGGDADLDFDGDYVSERASRISEQADNLWKQIDAAAKEEAVHS